MLHDCTCTHPQRDRAACDVCSVAGSLAGSCPPLCCGSNPPTMPRSGIGYSRHLPRVPHTAGLIGCTPPFRIIVIPPPPPPPTLTRLRLDTAVWGCPAYFYRQVPRDPVRDTAGWPKPVAAAAAAGRVREHNLLWHAARRRRRRRRWRRRCNPSGNAAVERNGTGAGLPPEGPLRQLDLVGGLSHRVSLCPTADAGGAETQAETRVRVSPVCLPPRLAPIHNPRWCNPLRFPAVTRRVDSMAPTGACAANPTYGC